MKTKSKYLAWAVVISVTAIMLIFFQGCNFMKKRYPKTISKEYTFNASNYEKLAVENPNGDVIIRKSDNPALITVKAEVTKHLTKKELDQPLEEVMINIDSTGKTLSISDVKSKSEKGFNFKIDFGSGETSYTIYVPEGINIDVEGTNGKVDLRDFNNDINAELTNGSIKAKNIYGNLKLTLTNGSISAELDSAKGIDFETTNGSIKLDVGTGFSGVFELESRNGKVSSKDVEFTNTSEKKNQFRGTLGNGDAVVKMQTTNGKITIGKK